jgi:hypothetical protein
MHSSNIAGSQSEAGKKESTARRLNRRCRPSGTPSSISSLDHRHSDARAAENGFATKSSVNKSAKVGVNAPAKAAPRAISGQFGGTSAEIQCVAEKRSAALPDL